MATWFPQNVNLCRVKKKNMHLGRLSTNQVVVSNTSYFSYLFEEISLWGGLF